MLLPALLLHGFATARLSGVPVGLLVATLVLSTLAVAGLPIASRPLLGVEGAAFTSVFQGSVRLNNYVGITLAAGLFGAQGVALATVATLATLASETIVPMVNVLCVLVLARFGTAGRPTLRGVARQLALNPLVLACLSGIGLQAADWGLPPGIEAVLRALGQTSLPLGLLCVGAALSLSSARAWPRPVFAGSVVKFMPMPLTAALACAVLGLHGPAAATALLFQALPTASSFYIMARQLGGDAPLMAAITAVQTILAGIAIPLAMAVLSVPAG